MNRDGAGTTTGSQTNGPSHPLARDWSRRSVPAFILVGVGLAADLLAFTQMPDVVPQHARLVGSPDTWTTRGHMLAFALIITVLSAAGLLTAGLVSAMTPEGLRIRDEEARRYWTHAEHWPIMRQRIWTVMAWSAGLLSVLVAVGVNVFTLSPRWGLPTWSGPLLILAGTIGFVWWLMHATKRMAALPDDGRHATQ